MQILTRYSPKNQQQDEAAGLTIQRDENANPIVLSFSYDADDLIEALLEDPERPPAETLGLREMGWRLLDTESAIDEGRHTQVVFARALTPEERAQWERANEARHARALAKIAEARAKATPLGIVVLTKELRARLLGAEQFAVGTYVQLGLSGTETIVLGPGPAYGTPR